MVNKIEVVMVIAAVAVILIQSVVIGVMNHRVQNLQMENQSMVEESQLQFEQLSSALSRARTELVDTKELKSRIDSLISDNDTLKKDLQRLRARPTSVINTTTSTGSDTSVVFVPGESTEIFPSWIPKHLDYTTPTGLIVASHDVSEENKSFTGQTHELQISSTTVLSTTPSGAQVAHTQLLATSSADPDKKIPLPITSSEISYVKNSNKVFFAPHLELGATIGGSSIKQQDYFTAQGVLGVSLIAFGETKDDNILRFLEPSIAVGIATRTSTKSIPSVSIGLAPILVNIGKPLPVFSDLWIAPQIGVSLQQQNLDTNPTIQSGFHLALGVLSTL